VYNGIKTLTIVVKMWCKSCMSWPASHTAKRTHKKNKFNYKVKKYTSKIIYSIIGLWKIHDVQ